MATLQRKDVESYLAALEGPHEQFQNLFSILGRYDWQVSGGTSVSIRSFFTRNHTDGFTGGRGQNEIQAAFDNTENFRNQGVNTVFTLNNVFGSKTNELKVLYSYETRPRFANGDDPEVQILDTGNGGCIYSFTCTFHCDGCDLRGPEPSLELTFDRGLVTLGIELELPHQ